MERPGITGFLLFLTLFFTSFLAVVAQSPADDSLLYKKSVGHLITLYHQAAGDQTWLFNGSQYAGYVFSFKEGHPFFNIDQNGTGSIEYEGILYDGVLLQYDEVQEHVIMEDKARRIQLLNDKITAFTLFNSNFLYLIKDSLNNALVKTGFYSLLYAGKTSLLKKEIKTIREDLSTLSILRYIDPHEYYYIKKDNVYYSLGNKKTVLRLLNDRKKDIQQYIRKNKLNYRKDRDATLIKIIAYYNQLNG